MFQGARRAGFDGLRVVMKILVVLSHGRTETIDEKTGMAEIGNEKTGTRFKEFAKKS